MARHREPQPPGHPGTQPADDPCAAQPALNCEALEGRQMLSGFYIVNMESGLALDDTNSSTSNGNLIQQ